jgi:uncharacterized membrane protein
MGGSFTTLALPIVAGSLTIAGISIAQRWGVQGKKSPMHFLAWSWSITTFLLGAYYISQWGWTYPSHLLPKFWIPVFLGASVNYVSQYIHARVATYKEGEVSFTAPLSAMTPGLITLLALTLGEVPGPAGTLGIFCMAAGSWVLLFKGEVRSWREWWKYLGPLYRLRLIVRYRDLSPQDQERTIVVWLLLCTAFLGTIGLLCDGLYTRRGGDLQGMWLALVAIFGMIGAGYVIQYFLQPREVKEASGSIRERRFLLAVLGYAVMYALTQWFIKPLYFETYVAYVGTLYRLHILFAAILGYVFFKEKEIKKRIFAAVLITIGALLIASEDLPAKITHQVEMFGF